MMGLRPDLFRKRWEVVYYARYGVTRSLPEREVKRTRHWFLFTARLRAADWETPCIFTVGLALFYKLRTEIHRLP